MNPPIKQEVLLMDGFSPQANQVIFLLLLLSNLLIVFYE